MTFPMVRLGLLLLMIIPLMGQDLNSTWQTYMETNASIVDMEDQKASYLQEQIEIKSEVNELQKSSNWYNSWIIKYLLSGHGKRQLVIIDSLRAFDRKLERLLVRQGAEIKELKLAYENVLEDYENNGLEPAEQSLMNLQNFRWGSGVNRHSPILFPDYTELLNLKLENPERRRMMLADVQGLLQAKIIELNSIKIVREEEEELALRLSSFHEDLGLQMDADQDAQQRDASGNSEKMLGWTSADAANEFAENRGGLELTDDMNQEAMGLSNINTPREEVEEMSLNQTSSKDLEYLTRKLAEYKIQLEIVNQELSQSP